MAHQKKGYPLYGVPPFYSEGHSGLEQPFCSFFAKKEPKKLSKKDGNPPVLYLFLESEFLSGEPVGRGLDPAVVPVWVTRRSKRRARAVRFPYVGPNRMDIKKNILLP